MKNLKENDSDSINFDLVGGKLYLWIVRSISTNKGYTSAKGFKLILEVQSSQTGVFKTISLTSIDCLGDVLFNLSH